MANLIICQAFGNSKENATDEIRSADRQASDPVEVEDEQFTATFAQMERALAAWPKLPSDGRDPLKVDRRVSDRLIDATASR